MSAPVTVVVALEADPRNVGRARAMLRDAVTRSGASHLLDGAVLALSEVVTNAFVHAGGRVGVHVHATAEAVRVEVTDGSTRLPARRHYAATAGTGRGLQLVDDLTTRWGVDVLADGKTVWFELDDAEQEAGSGSDVRGSAAGGAASGGDALVVTLRNVPLLMHVAWQEHAATLLREYLLHSLTHRDDVLTEHALASAAMNLLHEQLPAPVLPDEAEALMADAIEPNVSAEEVVLSVPALSVAHFETLDELLGMAIVEARAGRFLSPPTQPEIDEMRQWLCSEVARQAQGETTATPWLGRTDIRATLSDQASLTATYAQLAQVDEPLLATDEASIIVAASPAALELLGYATAADLLGRRVIVVVPTRFHQAHIAGTTLHATNGRDKLLAVPLTVPMVRADGTEVPVEIEVRVERFDDDRRVFVARFRPA